MKQGKGRTIRKVMGAGGGGGEDFQLARICFFSLTASAGIFFLGEPLYTNFFFFLDKYSFFLNSEILIHYLCFCPL